VSFSQQASAFTNGKNEKNEKNTATPRAEDAGALLGGLRSGGREGGGGRGKSRPKPFSEWSYADFFFSDGGGEDYWIYQPPGVCVRRVKPGP
jgi:hypothetical protein